MAAVLLFAAVLAVFMVFDFTVARLLVIVAVAAFIAVLPSFAPYIAAAVYAGIVLLMLLTMFGLSDLILRFLERKVSRHDRVQSRR